MSFLSLAEAGKILSLWDVPDDPRRTAAPGELESDEGYRESTEEHDADSVNDQMWVDEWSERNDAR
jgi:hypothetical protein